MGHLRKLLTQSIGTALVLTVLLVLMFADIASAGLITPESGGSGGADNTLSLYKIVLYIALGVFVAVEGVLIYSIIKFRRRRGDKPATFTGNKRVEIGWTLGAALILVILAVLTFVKLDGISNPPGVDLPEPSLVRSGSADQGGDVAPDPAVSGDRITINVAGQQYLWRFSYPDGSFSYHELVAPVDTVVTLKITSNDVAHSWWIPELGGKRDAIPGYQQYTWFKADEPGVYDGQCAELCGAQHANMFARVRIVPKQDYVRWLSQNKHDIDEAGRELERLRPKFEQLQDG